MVQTYRIELIHSVHKNFREQAKNISILAVLLEFNN